MNKAHTDLTLSTRRARALAGARLAIADLRAVGVEAKIIGSLVSGRFGAHSDVDFLVVACLRELKYAIEGKIEDRMGDIAFDVVYLDEVPATKRATFAGAAVDASRLR